MQMTSPQHPFLDSLWLDNWRKNFLPKRFARAGSPPASTGEPASSPIYIDTFSVGGVGHRIAQVVGAANAGWVDVPSDIGTCDLDMHLANEFRRTRSDWDVGLIQRVRGRDCVDTVARTLSKVGLSIRSYPCARLICTDVYSNSAQYLASRQRAFLGGVKRHYRRLQELGVLRMQLYGAGSVLHCDEALPHIEHIVANSWQGKAGQSIFCRSNAKVRDFHRNLLASERGESYAAAIAVLTLDDVPIAYQYGFQSATHYTNYAREYDQTFARHSPGSVLNLLYLSALFDSGITTVDFGVGDARDKWQWGDRDEVLYSVFVFHGGLHSRMFKFFQDMRRKAKSAYYSLSGECPF